MIDKVMFQMAGLLPPKYRGAYIALAGASLNSLIS
jgi:hypothetical protein